MSTCEKNTKTNIIFSETLDFYSLLKNSYVVYKSKEYNFILSLAWLLLTYIIYIFAYKNDLIVSHYLSVFTVKKKKYDLKLWKLKNETKLHIKLIILSFKILLYILSSLNFPFLIKHYIPLVFFS